MKTVKYTVEKHITTEWYVMATAEGEALKSPIAKCNSEAVASTIKGLYEETTDTIKPRRQRQNHENPNP